MVVSVGWCVEDDNNSNDADNGEDHFIQLNYVRHISLIMAM